MNNTLVYPRDEGPFAQTGTIVYLSDVTEELAPTCVVSKEHTREPSSLVPSVRTRERFPVLYEQEVAVTARVPAATVTLTRQVGQGDLLVGWFSQYNARAGPGLGQRERRLDAGAASLTFDAHASASPNRRDFGSRRQQPVRANTRSAPSPRR